jgi:MFS family permease
LTVSHASTDAGPQRLTFTHWLILIMAAIGFGFDIYVLLVMQYIGPGVLAELLPDAKPGSAEFNHWRGMLFFVPAFVGGLFGLVGGYLTDILGRRRVLTGSILLYAFSAFASGFATSLPMLLVFRCLTFIGVCVEFVAAVAWLAELFPNHEQRERALGYTQAFSSLGGMTVGAAFWLLTREGAALSAHLPAIVLPEFLASWLGTIQGPHSAWRYTLLSGAVPAIPLILIRPFMPESPAWKEKKMAGTLKRPSLVELFAPRLRRTTIVTTIMFACSYGAAFGAIQQVPYMVPGMPQYKERAENLDPKGQAHLRGEMAGQFGTVQEVGGLVGRFLLAYLAVRILGRRTLLRVFQLPGLIIVPLVFAFTVISNRTLFTLPFGGSSGTDVTIFHVGIFLTGLLVVAQFSFWGNYLPTVYPLHLRGTGESFAANIGGRILGTSFAWVTSEIAGRVHFGSDPVNMAYVAAGVALFVFLVGSLACFFLPEPKPKTMVE